MIKLDFIIAGAEKAGTSFLTNAFASSNEVFIPKNEIRIFRDPFYSDREPLEKYFLNKKDVKLGIKHPSYLGRPEVPERIYKHNPDVKVLFILRNPVERAISSYVHYMNNAQIPLIEINRGIMQMEEKRWKIPKYNDILEFGLYYKYLALYQKYFKAKSMLVIEYESFFDGTVDFSAITNFLGISPISGVSQTRINEGEYDWHKCFVNYCRAVMFNQYDNDLNVIGKKDHPYCKDFERMFVEFKESQQKSPMKVSDETKGMLFKYYEEDIKKLKANHILEPVNW